MQPCYFMPAPVTGVLSKSFHFPCRLVHDRELQLHDGTRLLREDRFLEIQSKLGLSEAELGEKHQLFKIHPDFFILATAGLPRPKSESGGKDKQGQWLSPELLSLFFYHRMPKLTLEEEMQIISSFVRDL